MLELPWKPHSGQQHQELRLSSPRQPPPTPPQTETETETESIIQLLGLKEDPVLVLPPLPISKRMSYIFQPKTGIFYDAATKFYYCPKSRLYYSEVDGRYLYAVASEQKTGKHTPLAPPGIDFLEFVPAVPSSSLPDKATTTTQKVVLSF